MKALSCNFNMVTILLFSVLIGLSCSNDADLLTDAVLSDSAINESNVVDDHFTIQPNKSIILNVLVNDGFSPGDNVRIIEISSPTYGSVEINDDNMSIIYTPQVLEEATQTEEDTETEEEVETEEEEEQEIQEEETQNEEEPLEEETQTEDNTQTEENSETTDTFTYTTEVINEDETTSTEEGTVEVVVDSSVENEDTPEEEEDTDSESTDDDTTEEEDTTTGQDGEEDSPTSEEDTNVLEEEEDPTSSQTANLLFSSGFEGVELSNQNNDYRYINGTDSDTGFSWPPKILGSTGEEQEPSGIHTINDGGQSTIANRLESVTGHNGNQTTALYQGIDGASGVTQTPYQINNIRENPDEMYITYWMKIDNTSLSGAHKWRALWEYKTKNYGSGGGFRMIAFIYTDNNGKAYWNFQGDRNPSNAVWEKPNFDIPVPRDEWFKVEYYFKWSEGSDGRAFMKVNGQLVGEHHGATTANSKDLDFIILTQVYGDSPSMHQWVDDIEIWDGLPY